MINHDPGDYTKNLSEFTILPTVMEALRVARDAGFEVVLITNQGGLAKDFTPMKTSQRFTRFWARNARKQDAPARTISSPHHPSTGRSLSRKPGSLMVERACAKHQLDPARSWMVGDKQRDLDAASPGREGRVDELNDPLLDAVRHILSTVGQP